MVECHCWAAHFHRALHATVRVHSLAFSFFLECLNETTLPCRSDFRWWLKYRALAMVLFAILSVSKMTSVNDTDHTLRLFFTQVTHQRCQAKTCMFAAYLFHPIVDGNPRYRATAPRPARFRQAKHRETPSVFRKDTSKPRENHTLAKDVGA